MKRWDEKEIDVLKSCYRKVPASMIAQELNRPLLAVYQKANELGITLPTKINFSEQDIEFLKNNYLTLSNGQLAEKLEKKKTIVRMKLYEMGLRRYDQKARAWTPEEDALLLANYRTMGDVALSKLIAGRTKGGVCKRRKTLQLERTAEQVAALVEEGRKKFLEHSYKPGHVYCVTEEGRKNIWITRRKNAMRVPGIIQPTQFVLNP